VLIEIEKEKKKGPFFQGKKGNAIIEGVRVRKKRERVPSLGKRRDGSPNHQKKKKIWGRLGEDPHKSYKKEEIEKKKSSHASSEKREGMR